MTERDEPEDDGHAGYAGHDDRAAEPSTAATPVTAGTVTGTPVTLTDQPPGVWAQVRDAVRPRSALLVIATVGLGLGFILSYVGALHHPTPRNLPFDVVAPAALQARPFSASARGHAPPPRPARSCA